MDMVSELYPYEKHAKDLLYPLHHILRVIARHSVYVLTIVKTQTEFVYKQVWHKRSVESHAATAQELLRDKPNQSKARLFVWLCKQEGQGTASIMAA